VAGNPYLPRYLLLLWLEQNVFSPNSYHKPFCRNDQILTEGWDHLKDINSQHISAVLLLPLLNGVPKQNTGPSTKAPAKGKICGLDSSAESHGGSTEQK
jgi:hypothetical protein